MNEGIAVLLGQLICMGTGLVKYIPRQHHIGSQAFRAVDLDQRGRHRHHDCGLYACQPGGFPGGFLPQLVGLDCQIRPFCKHFALLTQNLVVLRVAFAEKFALYKKI